jgi:hypothetical protein
MLEPERYHPGFPDGWHLSHTWPGPRFGRLGPQPAKYRSKLHAAQIGLELKRFAVCSNSRPSFLQYGQELAANRVVFFSLPGAALRDRKLASDLQSAGGRLT